jgi:transposase
MVLPPSVAQCRHTVLPTLEVEGAKLTPVSQALFAPLYDEFCALEKRLAYSNEKLAAIGETPSVCPWLRTIPGVGPLMATALVAAVSAASHCKNGRQCAAWLGQVPRQHSPGGKARLLGISKRGDGYVRKLLVPGARATLRWVGLKTDRRSQWVRARIERREKNRAAGARANKNGRIAWMLLHSEQT